MNEELNSYLGFLNVIHFFTLPTRNENFRECICNENESGLSPGQGT